MKIKKIPANYVLVEFERIMNEELKCGGVTLFLSTFFDPVKHTNHLGKVIVCPTTLVFDKKNPNYSLEWKNEKYFLKNGDSVYVTYNEIFSIFGAKSTELNLYNENTRYFEEDGKLYAFVKIDKIIYSIGQDGKRNMENGYVLAERLSDTTKAFDYLVTKVNNKCKIVDYGNPNSEYLIETYFDDDVNLLNGQEYVFNASGGVSSVNDNNSYVDGYLLLQRKDLMVRLE